MAKAKKPSTRKAPKSETAQKPATPLAGLPLIDTDLAAQTAARMLAARARLKAAADEPAEAGKESASFKAMKDHLQHPAAHAASSALGTAYGPQKSNLPAMGRDQVFHNQTQGVSRINVPRRTAG
jgi:hypothetical protein